MRVTKRPRHGDERKRILKPLAGVDTKIVVGDSIYELEMGDEVEITEVFSPPHRIAIISSFKEDPYVGEWQTTNVRLIEKKPPAPLPEPVPLPAVVGEDQARDIGCSCGNCWVCSGGSL